MCRAISGKNVLFRSLSRDPVVSFIQFAYFREWNGARHRQVSSAHSPNGWITVFHFTCMQKPRFPFSGIFYWGEYHLHLTNTRWKKAIAGFMDRNLSLGRLRKWRICVCVCVFKRMQNGLTEQFAFNRLLRNIEYWTWHVNMYRMCIT